MVDDAKKHHAVVSSLFPKNVHEQLLEQTMEQEKKKEEQKAHRKQAKESQRTAFAKGTFNEDVDGRNEMMEFLSRKQPDDDGNPDSPNSLIIPGSDEKSNPCKDPG